MIAVQLLQGWHEGRVGLPERIKRLQVIVQAEVPAHSFDSRALHWLGDRLVGKKRVVQARRRDIAGRSQLEDNGLARDADRFGERVRGEGLLGLRRGKRAEEVERLGEVKWRCRGQVARDGIHVYFLHSSTGTKEERRKTKGCNSVLRPSSV